jgi:flagellar biosynthetic protein FlhB
MAEDQDQSQKTEEPTQKKLDDARQKGQVASSKEVSNFILIGSATLTMAIALPSIMRDTTGAMTHYLRHAGDPNLVGPALSSGLLRAIAIMGLALVIPLAVTIVGAIAGSALQNAILWSTENLQPKLDRISPIAGFKRLFSLKSVVEFLKGVVKITLMATIGVAVVWPSLERLVAAGHLEVIATMTVLWETSLWVSAAIAACLALVAALDYAYQRFEFLKQMRMSRRDIQDEHKQSDGDPMIKQRLRQLRMDKARQRMMAEVPTSTVVVTNPTHFAVALRYESGITAAPKVVAKGVDEVALRIRTIAKEHEVPIVENPPLARALHRSVELGEMIPPEHYQAVAEVIGYVLRLRPQGPSQEAAPAGIREGVP